MNHHLVEILKANIGQSLTPDLAADLMLAADQIPTLVSFDVLDRIKPQQCGEFVFAHEKLEDILEEMKPLHVEHWKQTEQHRHSIEFNPDYETFFRHERAGRAVVFTLRKEGRLLGNFSVYVSKSMHTQTLFSREDTLFLMPEARKGRTAMRFIEYGERALQQIGVREINVSVKVINKAGRFFQMIGYRHTENGLSKILEVANA
ncbi:hypothetical protein [Nitrosovibrio sp. Nv4]|uniref:hypothetical protein n=1 Tax=Nitrosovibrio sp. Nv4 TaxID=1945880 RepID=UPI000BD6FA06|nr:hypothetical protein [Nitrosovibrio sp. Nv4]SOD42349.1 hypothetical protein SAMN06298226_2688 [Nitrosovibrio sp. Nv4]